MLPKHRKKIISRGTEWCALEWRCGWLHQRFLVIMWDGVVEGLHCRGMKWSNEDYETLLLLQTSIFKYRNASSQPSNHPAWLNLSSSFYCSINAFEQQNNLFSLFRPIKWYGFRIRFMDDYLIKKALYLLYLIYSARAERLCYW